MPVIATSVNRISQVGRVVFATTRTRMHSFNSRQQSKLLRRAERVVAVNHAAGNLVGFFLLTGALFTSAGLLCNWQVIIVIVITVTAENLPL